MKIKYTLVLQALERHVRWVAKLTPRNLGESAARDRAHDVVVWCLDFVELSPTTDLTAWIARRPHRKLLDDPERAVRTVRGRRAILELLELTISEVAASASFLPQVEASLLPGVREPETREMATARTAKATAARAANRWARRDAIQRRLAALT